MGAAAIDQLHGAVLREVGIDDDQLLDRVLVDALAQLGELAEVGQALVAALVQREEADRLQQVVGVLKRVRDLDDAVAGADQDRAALIAEPVEQPAGRAS